MDQEDKQTEIKPLRSKFIIKAAAILVLIVFIVFSMPNLSFFLSGSLNFLNENGSLVNDEIVKQCKPAVVYVEVTGSHGEMRQGTGFNISPEGVIVTNKHVVENAALINIQFADGRKYYANNYTSETGDDIAIIKLKGSNLPTIKLDKEYKLKRYEVVTVIGNPLGYERMAQRGRAGTFHFIEGNESPVFDINIQVNPGNSGSPVINSKAQVVGIIFAASDGHALAIDISRVKY